MSINDKCQHNSLGGVLNSSMSVGLKNNLKDAIEDVGVNIPKDTCIWEYPEIIRKNLIAKTISVLNITGKDIIKITGDYQNNLVISTEINKSEFDRPNYASPDKNYSDIVSADIIFKDLFDNILPNVRGLYAADITTTDENGIDTTDWYNELFKVKGRKDNLERKSKYLRIYLTCQAEPLFIYIDANVNSLNKYNIVDSDTVSFKLNDDDMTISAHISCIDESYINNLK